MSSMPKELLFGGDGRCKLGEGIDVLADIVASTFGSRGKRFGVRAWETLKRASSGSDIARHVVLDDPHANMGLSIGRALACEIEETLGDGTKTGIILLRALVRGGLKSIASGSHPIHLIRGMEKGVKAVVQAMGDMAMRLGNFEAVARFAAAGSDSPDIGRVIAEALTRVGESGSIAIEKGSTHEVEVVEGVQFDCGYISPYFCTDLESMVANASHPAILVTDKRISSVQEILSFLKQVAPKRDLLMIAGHVEGEAFSTLVLSALQRTLKVCVVGVADFQGEREALLEDIATVTGATVVSEKRGMRLGEVGLEVLGEAKRAGIAKESTAIFGGRGSAEAIASRIAQIEKQIGETTRLESRKELELRRAKLREGVAIIRIGESSDREGHRVLRDSLRVMRTAWKSGVVPGGGIALLRGGRALRHLPLPREERVGTEIVSEACLAPFKQIVENGGRDSALYLRKILQKGGAFGLNALTGRVEDLFASRIVDCFSIVKGCLECASAAAATVFSSGVLIANAPKG